MHLKKLNITGFKSFAQKTTLEFDRGIVSIVGPNGSGKSNVADAIRWVLGEQSLKLLRGKRSEDVIFSGSSLKARLGMAEVSMELDNSGRTMPVDASEVVITRRIYRNGEGEYFLNKRPARLQDILLLLAKSGFGQKSYSVIAQGMIDHILVASPAERKAFFDEAAGVREFQIKREQAMGKLELSRENLNQAHMLLAEIEPRLRTLTRQVRRLEKRGVIEEELRTHQRQYYTQRMTALAKELGSQQDIAHEHERQYGAQEKELTALQRKLEALERERSRQDVFDDLQRRYSDLLEQKNGVLKEQVVLEGKDELAAARSGELNTVWLENRDRELTRTLERLEEEVSALEQDVAKREKTLNERSKLRERFAQELTALREQFTNLKTRADRGGVDLRVLASEFATLQEAFTTFHDAIQASESERHLKDLKREARHVQEKLTGYGKRFTDAEKTLTAQEVLDVLTTLLGLLTERDEQLGDVHEVQGALERKQERLTVLRESKGRLTDEHGRVQRELQRLQPGAGKDDQSAQKRELDARLVAFDKELQRLREQILNFNKEEQQKKQQLFDLQKAFRTQQQSLNATNAVRNDARVALAKLETRKDDLGREIRSELPPELAEELNAVTSETKLSATEREEKLLADIDRCKHQLELIGGIDETVTAEFKETDERHNKLSTQVEDLDQAIDRLQTVITELDATIKKQFRTSFGNINREFGKYFKVLFEGGSAKLVLQESEVAIHEEGEEGEGEDGSESAEVEEKPVRQGKTEKVIAGVDIIAIPPGKRISGITMLSGGERALTAIALISAIISTRPSPFVILDEVDAALDEANSQRFAAIIRELAHHSQFITITHNRATMQISSILYGVTMNEDGISKLLSIKMEDAERVIEQHGNR